MKKKFIHFPKCGGLSLKEIMRKANVEYLGHYTSLSDKNLNSSEIYYSNIRNPIHYYVSFWRYRVASFKNNTYSKNKNYSHIEYIKDKPNFKKWLRCCLDNDEQLGDMTKNIIKYWYGNNKKLFMDEYFHSPKKRYICQKIIKLENIKSDLKKFGFKETHVPYVNTTNNQDDDYYSYYDQELLNLVYKKDIYIFLAFDYPKPV